jgi:hypothetical protein
MAERKETKGLVFNIGSTRVYLLGYLVKGVILLEVNGGLYHLHKNILNRIEKVIYFDESRQYVRRHCHYYLRNHPTQFPVQARKYNPPATLRINIPSQQR